MDNNNRWLHERLKTEDPSIEPHFAFNGTVNWIRALAILVDDKQFCSRDLNYKYRKVNRRSPSVNQHDTSVFQFTFMAFQNLSALQAIVEAGYPSDFVRNAIVSWYYGVYYSASAMLAAADGSIQENHQNTANSWDRQVVQNDLIPHPFDLRTSTLVEKECDKEISNMRQGNHFNLEQRPDNKEEALGACLSYLKGTASYERERAKSRVKTFKEFKNLGVDDFRTNSARTIRDKHLEGKSVCFLHQAFRFRGKANYRDALYLGYGTEYTSRLEKLLRDLYAVLAAFLKAASHYCARRVKQNTWHEFIQDLRVNSRLKHNTDILQLDATEGQF